MVTRILQPRGSSGTVLDYNEGKVLSGDASLVQYRNLGSGCMSSVYETFERYERNPAVSERTRATSFHMAVNPSPEDRIDEEGVLAYIAEVMQELGYGEQPWVVYRHNDIDREHYHVASVRVDGRGKAINREHEGLRVLEIQRRLAPKYGFTVGRQAPAAEARSVSLSARAFDPSAANVMNSLASLYQRGLRYDFHSFYQFACIMRAMGVKVTKRTRKDGGTNVILRGLDGNGRPCTRYYSMERHMKQPGAEMFRSRLEENNAVGVVRASRKEQLMAMSDWCLDRSGSSAEYEAMLAEIGVSPTILRDEATGAIRRVTLVETRNAAITDTAISGELFLKRFTRAEEDGRWQKPAAPDGTRKGRTERRVAERKPFFDQRRKAELDAFIRARLEAFAGKAEGRQEKRGAPRLKA